MIRSCHRMEEIFQLSDRVTIMRDGKIITTRNIGDIDQKEIDLLYVRRDVVYPIEIKKSAAPVKPTKNFRVLEKFHMKIGTGLVVDTCDKIRPVNELAYFYPVSLLGM